VLDVAPLPLIPEPLPLVAPDEVGFDCDGVD
jgi:hypothetical protein